MLNLIFPSNLDSSLQGVQFVDIRVQLPVNPAYTWAQLAGVRDINALNTIVVHHDAIPKGKSAQYADIELASRIATSHINSRKHHEKGDPGMPYDVWIRNGIAYWCNDIEPREYGVASNNGYTVNVCVSGDYHNYDTLEDADRKALYAVLLMLKECMPADKYIKGHREITATNCPGFSMNQVRDDIAALELKMAVQDTPNAQMAKIFDLNVRFLDIYKKATNPQDKFHAEAVRKMLEAHAMWVERGVL